MIHGISLLFFGALILLSGCSRGGVGDEILRTKYYHPYGPEMNAPMWEERGKNGEMVQYYKSGIAIRTNYADGVQHGMVNWTFPNSSITHRYEEYEHGVLISFGVNYENGSSQFQEESHEDGSTTRREWYTDGTPKYIEEWNSNKHLIEGRYFTQEGDIEAEVTQGKGIRIDRSRTGALQLRDHYLQGSPVLREEFYLNGITKYTVSLKNGEKDGVAHSYHETGQPIAIEQWSRNCLNGMQTYFDHGLQIASVPFKDGVREGVETRFRPGTEEEVAKISWHNGLKHGLSTFIFPDQEIVEWYWRDGKVTQEQFQNRKQQADFASTRYIQTLQ
ncbi:MAG: hypothetical protein QRY74_01395 [Chlamydia sp.]